MNCSSGCGRSVAARGLCGACYLRMKRAEARVNPQILTSAFWDYVEKSDGCWEWSGAKDRDGYGKLISGYRDVRAHRLSWELHFGAIPSGLLVCHHCDNPSCVRPDHLFLGDAQANSDDMVLKGRSASGDKNPMRLYPELVKRGDENPSRRYPERLCRGTDQADAKLTEDQVRDIRARYVPRKVSLPMLAREYGVGTSTIHRVVKRTHWRHVD